MEAIYDRRRNRRRKVRDLNRVRYSFSDKQVETEETFIENYERNRNSRRKEQGEVCGFTCFREVQDFDEHVFLVKASAEYDTASFSLYYPERLNVSPRTQVLIYRIKKKGLKNIG